MAFGNEPRESGTHEALVARTNTGVVAVSGGEFDFSIAGTFTQVGTDDTFTQNVDGTVGITKTGLYVVELCVIFGNENISGTYRTAEIEASADDDLRGQLYDLVPPCQGTSPTKVRATRYLIIANPPVDVSFFWDSNMVIGAQPTHIADLVIARLA